MRQAENENETSHLISRSHLQKFLQAGERGEIWSISFTFNHLYLLYNVISKRRCTFLEFCVMNSYLNFYNFHDIEFYSEAKTWIRDIQRTPNFWIHLNDVQLEVKLFFRIWFNCELLSTYHLSFNLGLSAIAINMF